MHGGIGRLRLIVGQLILATLTVSLSQAAPWDRVKLFKRVEADKDAEYPLSEEHGPWMILAVTFMGENAKRDAHALVYELRKRHHLEAYTHKAHFDFTGNVKGRGMNRDGAPVRMRYQRDTSYDEVAVLVGNYRGVDDPEAQETLKKLKYLWPVCLDEKEGEVSRPLAGWREFKRFADKLNNDEQRGKGPMGHAFLVTNPMLPREYFVPKGIDQFVVDLNKDLEHSLLDCPGKYTVKVATFTGNSVIQASGVKGGDLELPTESKLQQAEMMAQKLTEYLRSKGWEAYQFHDRHSSIVTVGSFNSVGIPRPDGKTEINPAVHKIMQTFAPQRTPTGAPGKQRTLTKMNIPLDLQPMPVKVPQQSVTQSYSQTLAR